MRGILERQMRKCWGLVCCRGQGGVGIRVAGTMHASCHADIGKMRECASVVLGACRPLLDLTCSLYHIPPRRACPNTMGQNSSSTCGNAACAAAISSIDDATLSLMKTGFTVSPGPRRVLVLARIQARVHGRAAGRAKGGYGGSDAAGPLRAGLRRATRRESNEAIWNVRRDDRDDVHYDPSTMRSPREHREADAPGARHVLRRCRTIHGSSPVSVCV